MGNVKFGELPRKAGTDGGCMQRGAAALAALGELPKRRQLLMLLSGEDAPLFESGLDQLRARLRYLVRMK